MHKMTGIGCCIVPWQCQNIVMGIFVYRGRTLTMESEKPVHTGSVRLAGGLLVVNLFVLTQPVPPFVECDPPAYLGFARKIAI